jgi:hypothetical protein
MLDGDDVLYTCERAQVRAYVDRSGLGKGITFSETRRTFTHTMLTNKYHFDRILAYSIAFTKL